MLLLLLSRFSRVGLCATPWTAAHRPPLSLGFSRQKYWSGLPFPTPRYNMIFVQKFKVCNYSTRWIQDWTATEISYARVRRMTEKQRSLTLLHISYKSTEGMCLSQKDKGASCMTSKKKRQPGLFERWGVSPQHQTIFLTTLPETNFS